MSKNLIQKLRERGFIAQITDEQGLTEQLNQKFISVYCGFDPTNDSLHIGHIVPLLCLKYFQLSGHRPIILLGGATGLIGDPSMKLNQRKPNNINQVQIWSEKIKCQILKFLNFSCGDNSAVIVNNYDWYNTMHIITFLQNVGKYFSVNQMINKEMIKKRLHCKHNKISFTEFSYNLLQSYDFTHLYKKYNVLLQIGGSDQWGNITSGINLTHRLYQNKVYGFTVPLITKTDGTKFGKTETNTIWLDPNKTSPYKFYQFWINIADNDVYNFLKLFTLLDILEIENLEKINDKNSKLQAQHILAEEITLMVHGASGLKSAQRITNNLFKKNIIDLTEDDFIQLIQDGMPKIILNQNIDLQQALVESKLVSSRRQARSMIEAKAITINGHLQLSSQYIFNDTDKLYFNYTILCRGKKNYCLLYWQ